MTAPQYTVRLHRSADKDLDKLPDADFERIEARIDALATNPSPHDRRQIKGYKPPVYRLDEGEYRVVFQVDQPTRTVFVLVIDRRNDKTVYKRLARLLG